VRHLTLKLVWGECIKATPGGYGSSQSCDPVRRWRREQGRGATPRQEHRPGEPLQIDGADDTVVVMDGEATWTRQMEERLASHVRAFGSLGGVPGALVPDNLKSGVTRAN